jgi:hypothetical protein
MHAGGAAAQHHRQQQIEALKAIISLVEVDEATFRLLLRSNERPTLVKGRTGFWRFKKHIYMTSYDGFVFIHRAGAECDFRADAPQAFVIAAQEVQIPAL